MEARYQQKRGYCADVFRIFLTVVLVAAGAAAGFCVVTVGACVADAAGAAPVDPTGANGLRRPAAAGGMATPKSESDRNSGSLNTELSSLIVRRLPSVAKISAETGDCVADVLDKRGAEEELEE